MASTGLEATRFWYASACVQDASEGAELVAGADAALAWLMEHASLIARHQLCSDLGVLAAADPAARPAVAAAVIAWRQRREELTGRPRFLDTRYDAGHLLACQSRRLVDVCADLRLDVTQPEPRGTSMTALHRRWLQDGDSSVPDRQVCDRRSRAKRLLRSFRLRSAMDLACTCDGPRVYLAGDPGVTAAWAQRPWRQQDARPPATAVSAASPDLRLLAGCHAVYNHRQGSRRAFRAP